VIKELIVVGAQVRLDHVTCVFIIIFSSALLHLLRLLLARLVDRLQVSIAICAALGIIINIFLFFCVGIFGGA
jgi:uncharacterized membrane protein